MLNGEDADVVEKSCIRCLYILLYSAELCKNLDGDYAELGCHKGTTAKRLAERVNFQDLGK